MSEPPPSPDDRPGDQAPQVDPQGGGPTGPPAYPYGGPPQQQPGYPPQQPVYPPQQPAYPPQQPGYPPQQWTTSQPGLPAYPAYAVPDLPKATAALVVGIVSVAGGLTCLLPILAAPVAWVLGVQARREIRRAPQHWGGEGRATAGMVLGIIGTVLLLLGILLVVVLIVVAVNDPTAFDDNTGV